MEASTLDTATTTPVGNLGVVEEVEEATVRVVLDPPLAGMIAVGIQGGMAVRWTMCLQQLGLPAPQ